MSGFPRSGARRQLNAILGVVVGLSVVLLVSVLVVGVFIAGLVEGSQQQQEPDHYKVVQWADSDTVVYAFPGGAVFEENGWVCVFTGRHPKANFCVPEKRRVEKKD